MDHESPEEQSQLRVFEFQTTNFGPSRSVESLLKGLPPIMASASAIDDELYSRQVGCSSPLAIQPRHAIDPLSILLFRFPASTEHVCCARSLQLFVMGHAAQARMQESDVLVVGLTGVGAEIGKGRGVRCWLNLGPRQRLFTLMQLRISFSWV
jgi:hypothetical protein